MERGHILTIFNLYCYGLIGTRLVAYFSPLAVPARTVQYGLENVIDLGDRINLPLAFLNSWWPHVVRLRMTLDCFARGSAEKLCYCLLSSAESRCCA